MASAAERLIRNRTKIAKTTATAKKLREGFAVFNKTGLSVFAISELTELTELTELEEGF